MATTYEPIATLVDFNSSSYSFTSIPQTYSRLRLVWVGTAPGGTPGNVSLKMRYNSDSSALYSQTTLYGSGSAAGSQRNTGTDIMNISFSGVHPTIPHMHTVDIFSYTGSTNKTCLITGSEDNNGSGYTYRDVGLYRSTSAITSITLSSKQSGSPWNTAGTVTLYGITNA